MAERVFFSLKIITRDLFTYETGDDEGVPCILATLESIGDLLNIHIHAMITEGVFTPSGHFIRITGCDQNLCPSIWKEKVFGMLKTVQNRMA